MAENGTRSSTSLTGVMVLAFFVMLVLSLMVLLALQAVSNVFDQARTEAVSALLVMSASIGVIVMASIQTVRAVWPLRGQFHGQRIARWLTRPPGFRKDADARYVFTNSEYAESIARWRDPVEMLVDLALSEGTTHEPPNMDNRARIGRAFFDLPLEQLCGQISAGAERAIHEPKKYAQMVLLLAGPAGLSDAHTFLDALSKVNQPQGDTSKEDLEAQKKAERQRVLDAEALVRARASLEERIRRNVDRLQITVGDEWRRLIRGMAIALSAAVGLVASLAAGQYVAAPIATAMAAVVGGFFAMLARDLTAVVERLRRNP